MNSCKSQACFVLYRLSPLPDSAQCMPYNQAGHLVLLHG